MKTFTIKFKKLLVPLAVQCMLMLGFVAIGYGQNTVFLETFGNGLEGSVNSYSDYTNAVDGLAITSNLASTLVKQDISSTNPGASGQNNVQLTGTENIVISGINTEGFVTVDLAFGIYRSTPQSGMTVEYKLSTEANWTSVPSLSLTGASGWVGVSSQDVEFPKNKNWSLRFSYSGGRGLVRVDDIHLTGGTTQPVISSYDRVAGGIGTEVTVSGNNLESIHEIYFVNAGISSYAYNKSNTSFKFQIPEGAVTTPLEFYDVTGWILLAERVDPFTVVIPTITSFNPTSATPGTLITFTGTNLGSATSVVFGSGGSAAPAFAPLDDQVQVYLPASASTGRVDIVTADYGTAYSTQNFTVLKPSITRIENASGATVTSAREGASITIVGTRLNIGGTPTVTFGGGVNAIPTSVTETRVTITVPAGAETGAISLTTTESTATSSSFTIIKPTITITGTPLASFQSVENTASSVQQYTISATNLTGGINVAAPANFQVSTDNVNFGQTAAVLQSNGTASGTIYVRYLPSAAGSHVGFIVHESSGISQSVEVQGTATEAPLAISGLSPSSAKLNQTIRISGTRLNVGGTPVVTFTGGATAAITSASATALDVTVPVTAQTGPITVTTSEGTATSGTFTVLSPVITITQSLSPFNAVSGTTTASQQYTVRGTNIATNLIVTAPTHFQVSLNNISFGPSVTLSPSSIENNNRAIYVRYRPTAAGNHSGNLVHTTEGATESFAVFGTAVEPLAITSLSPTSGKVGETVQINGYRLNQGGTPTVRFFGNVAATVSSATATAVIVTVPEGAQTGAISLMTTEGTVSSQSFTVLPTLEVSTTSLEPFSTQIGEPSAPQFYTISGNSLTEAVRVSAPANFQVSLSETSGFGDFVNVQPVSGTIDNVPVYVRYYATVVAANSGNITNTTAGVVEALSVAVEGEATPIDQGSLPVEFVSFTHVQQQDGVLLEWRTATETNNSHFEVEVTSDLAKGFERIGQVNSKAGNSVVMNKYQYKHRSAASGTRYYRLKQVDLDGTFEYSNVIAVEVAAKEAVALVSVAPNPINYNSKVYITALNEGKAVLRLSSMEGKQIYTKEAAMRKGENEVQLPVYDQLSKGVYLLTVELNGTVHKVKVLKQ